MYEINAKELDSFLYSRQTIINVFVSQNVLFPLGKIFVFIKQETKIITHSSYQQNTEAFYQDENEKKSYFLWEEQGNT